MGITRRAAVRTLFAAGATAALPSRVWAREGRAASPDAASILYDSTRCVGCKDCVRACAAANGGDGRWGAGDRLTTGSLTALKRYEYDGIAAPLKVQCMHCVDPACVSACMLGAMRKGEDGAVTWNGDLCVGCRYCQIACPFNVPRFEWDTPAPELKKCQLCPERRAQGLLPACVEACRRGALAFGTRADMLAEAHRRLAAHPRRYNGRVYGETDGGGTQVLYLGPAGVPFQAMGLPVLGEHSIPSLPETIQHTLYKGFIAPLALFGFFGAVVRRNARKIHEVEAAAGHHEGSEPVRRRIFTWPFAALFVVFMGGLVSIALRFTAGLGAATNLSDGYPMGIWIAFDVVTGTALACGGYAVAILVYLANRGKYHPLVRAAILTSALGYTLGGLSVLIDIGRAWNFYKIPLYFRDWNFNSILLEVALCIMLYTMVLWIELSPAFLEQWKGSRLPKLRALAVRLSPVVERAMPYLIALGLLLPTMHQSSLGSLMLIAGQKLHPLWHTPLLPLLFLISAVGMGYAAVTLEAILSARAFRRPNELPMLRALARPIAVVLLAYAAIRTVDVINRGQLGAAFALDGFSLLFQVEMLLFVVPAIALLRLREHAGEGFFLGIGAAVVLAGALYRFSTYLFAFRPGPEWSYIPALPEVAVTLGLLAAEIMAYLILVKKLPILRGAPPTGPRGRRLAEPSPAA
ncbi:MAG TPA: Ni/Fe-hydrogenase cytochrome b subunit [Longimicrobiales bacterium]|nr:Ni/Fe-hydrogenase cytochrome b subunit [Longimicrobiales bacterium]